MRYLAGFMVGVVSLAAASVASAQATPAAGGADSPAVVGRTVLNPSDAQISGRVVTPNGRPLANVTVRARNMISGEIGGSTSTTAAGQFSLNVAPGSYLLEVVAANGQIVGTSPFISATAGTAITSVTVTTAALGATTGSGLASTLLGTTAARTITYAAATAGVAGVVLATDVATASPSR
jgi:hypothetical protein